MNMTSPLSQSTDRPLIQKERRTASGSTPLPTVPEAASVASTPELQQGEFNPADGAKPSSPFYRHATPSLAIDRLKKAAKATTTRYSPLDPEDPPTLHRQPVESTSHHTQRVIRANWNCGANRRHGLGMIIKGRKGVAKGMGLSFCVHAVDTRMALNGWTLIDLFQSCERWKQLVPDPVGGGCLAA
ncbi:uncharacterized protein BO96DRAFT_439480 [Aspergillus niger CBS 101883]|uniref:Contig An04c0220, genomic contig n=2 Tax=Aspergillus niger TaxID=5061 RepID=A2QJM0_ASPNC|nr:uncharacterized protein An04g07540 [Aspergillus niger]XP_025449016.1 uncharacterized protein BO96DRAFT_439480 [Aspergillus niger CBS 101883]PYH50961.1 hypothetical protein BO96DRAFT_439480 [Aspergillus niger CBS 101883]CAK38910.1 unnamed protein product [Aspergillus niger]